jgi:glycosyltransferase involved in cell wall biosynthesis
MELTLFTNIPSPYNISLCNALAKKLPGNFSLVCWEPIDDERIKLGWTDDSNQEWLVKAWTSKSAYTKAIDLILSADVVVWGFAPVSMINRRVEAGKLTFRYTEREFKRGRWRILDPRVFKWIFNIIKFSNKKNYHLLSVGPYCAEDFRFLRAFKNKMWRWGYFPEMPENQVHKKTKDIATILWAGRMIHWKRVDLLLRAAAWARANGCKPFFLRIIGYGPEEGRLKALAAHLGLLYVCKFDGPMSPAEIGLAMNEADIYVLPSDQNEGWGVVVNEAMSHGCCVVGAKQVGAVPWLIQDGENGFVFEDDSPEKLGQLLQTILNNPEKLHELGFKAQNTMMNLWSPTVAADRLLNLIKILTQGGKSPFHDGGPCSPA